MHAHIMQVLIHIFKKTMKNRLKQLEMFKYILYMLYYHFDIYQSINYLYFAVSD